MTDCPRCSEESAKVIYMGFPMRLCSDDECNTLWGFWSWVPLPWFNGCFLEYEGSYWAALWHWMFGDLNDHS